MNEPKNAFDNAERRRWYGLRIGDIVRVKMATETALCEVVALDGMDQNRVTVERYGVQFEAVAEWCEIVTTVEARGES